jgi:beta-lactam-binding protein with PASTA domain
MLGDSMRRRRKAPESEGMRKRRTVGSGSGLSLGRWLLLALGILVVSFGVGYLLSSQLLFPRPETAGTGIPVPDLTGEDRTTAETVLREAGLEIGEVTELAHGDAEPGRVLAQTPIAGQQLREGAAVSFAVSAGPAEPRVPPVAGLSAGTAREILERAGFAVEVKQTRSPDVPEGVVDRTDPPAGAPRPLPSTVTMIVSAETADAADTTLPMADTTRRP